MSRSETIAAVAFYVGLAFLGWGAIAGARGAIERRGKRAGHRAIALVVLGGFAIGVAVVVFALGPRTMLPF